MGVTEHDETKSVPFITVYRIGYWRQMITFRRSITRSFEYHSRLSNHSFFVPLSLLFVWLLFNSSAFGITRNVNYFDIQNLRLNMKLDEVINAYNINNVKTSKDKYGLINGFEIVKEVDDMKIVLNFTGQKRLYRIDYTNVYRSMRFKSEALYNKIKRKYGDPTVENVELEEGESRNIHACWGATCTKFTPTTPALKADISYFTGKVKLTLSDNRIFNTDWKKYKEKYNDKKVGRSKDKGQNNNQILDF